MVLVRGLESSPGRGDISAEPWDGRHVGRRSAWFSTASESSDDVPLDLPEPLRLQGKSLPSQGGPEHQIRRAMLLAPNSIRIWHLRFSPLAWIEVGAHTVGMARRDRFGCDRLGVLGCRHV